jgi:DNA-directed RNA polymerase specialized sigma24 family protein
MAEDVRAEIVAIESAKEALREELSYVQSRAIADEVVQDTRMGVIKGIDRFEGRCR